MKYLFMFTIGPVKSFIEGSRKARDMLAGSKLLSGLMQQAIDWLKAKDGIDILFPLTPGPVSSPNIPNRLVAECDGIPDEQLLQIAECLSAFIRQEFLTTCLEILQSNAQIAEPGLRMAKEQLQDFLEIYWLFEPFEDIAYAEAYHSLFTTMQDVKGIRRFDQTHEPFGRKCTLFPEYNAIFAKKKQTSDNTMAFPHHVNASCTFDITENPRLRFAVKDNEALSAIGLVKRMYQKNNAQIYSTRQMLLRSRVSSNVFHAQGIPETNGELMDSIANVTYDLYNHNTWENGEYPDEAVALARKLYKAITAEQIRLCSYYALIKFDGDDMGDAFRNLKTSAMQQELSRRISRFADKAPDILTSHGGLPVFAGGEDFLGFLPLDSLFDCLKVLYLEFREIVGLTFSAGISVAHLMQPLKEVMAQAERMEQAAKNAGKNAFSVGIIKRSGENVNMPGYHFTAASGEPVFSDVAALIKLLKDSGSSKALFFQIARLMEALLQENIQPEAELLKPLLKKCISAAQIDEHSIDRSVLLQKLLMFYHAQPTGFLETLNGIVFLSREVN